MKPKSRLAASNSGNLDAKPFSSDSELSLTCKGTATVLACDGIIPSFFYRKVKATNYGKSQERELETRNNSRSRRKRQLTTNARLKKAKDANKKTEVRRLHSVDAFIRISGMEDLRNVIDDIKTDLDTVVKTVMYEEYESRKTTLSSSYHLCHKEPQNCYSVHGKHLEICHPLQSILNGYCNQSLWTCAAEYVNMFLIGYEYPSPVTILHLLDFILNSHEVSAVVKTIHTISHFVSTHPPYVPEMRQYYIDLLTSDCGHKFATIKRNGLLHSLIDLLKDINDNVVPKKVPAVKNFRDVAVECAEENKYDYKALSREQKLQRLTWILEWIAHTFEMDFINFLAKHWDNPSEYIKKEKARPLILATLWKGEDTVEFNEDCIITLIEGWVRGNVLKLPLSFLQNLMKIIKLIAETAFFCDFSLGPYPNYGQHCDTLARHIVHSLSDLKAEDILHAIHAIDPEWLAFRVAYLMTCKEVEWIPSERITIENMVNLCCYVLGGTPKEDTNEEEIRRPFSVIQNKAGRMSLGERNELVDTRLKRACSLDDAKQVLKLLRQDDVDINVADSDGRTALHEAVFKGSVQCVRALLSYKPKQGKKPINFHAKNIEGITPLMCAVMANKLEIAKLLLRYGGVSILRDKNSRGKTAKDLATSTEMQKLLCDYAEKFSSHAHVSYLAISLAKLLIPFYMSVYRIHRICKPQFQKKVKSSTLVLDLTLFKREIANLKILKYALENLPYLADYDYLISAFGTDKEELREMK